MQAHNFTSNMFPHQVMGVELGCGAWTDVEPAVWLANGDFNN
jgi:hypothetical protein